MVFQSEPGGETASIVKAGRHLEIFQNQKYFMIKILHPGSSELVLILHLIDEEVEVCQDLFPEWTTLIGQDFPRHCAPIG